jgi:cholesterol transport system auxiliary component
MMKPLLISGLALSLSGCVSFGAKPPPTLLTITSGISIAAGDARMAGAGEAITIAVPQVPQAIAGNRIAVSDGATEIAYIKNAQWVEPPARLFQRLLVETVAAKTGKVVVDPRQFAVAPAVQLSGQIKSFGVTVAFSGATTGEAVVIYDGAMSRDRGAHVMTRRFEARFPVSKIESAPAGAALNRAANKVALEVAAWVAGG